jgi:hypothetical protein
VELPELVDDVDVPEPDELPEVLPDPPELPPSAAFDEESVVLPPQAPASAAAVVAAINAERSLRYSGLRASTAMLRRASLDPRATSRKPTVASCHDVPVPASYIAVAKPRR